MCRGSYPRCSIPVAATLEIAYAIFRGMQTQANARCVRDLQHTQESHVQEIHQIPFGSWGLVLTWCHLQFFSIHSLTDWGFKFPDRQVRRSTFFPPGDP